MEPRVHEAGLDDGDRDPRAVQLVGQALAETGDGELRRPVHGVVRRRQLAEDAGDEDQLTPPSAQHRRQHPVGRVDHPHQVGLDHGPVVGEGDLLEGAVRPPAGVVHQHLDLPQTGLDTLAEAGHRLGVGYVAGQDQRPRAGQARRLLQGAGAAPHQRQTGPSRGQGHGQGAADAAAGPGDHHHGRRGSRGPRGQLRADAGKEPCPLSRGWFIPDMGIDRERLVVKQGICIILFSELNLGQFSGMTRRSFSRKGNSHGFTWMVRVGYITRCSATN